MEEENNMEKNGNEPASPTTEAETTLSQTQLQEERKQLEESRMELEQREKELEERMHDVESKRMLASVGLPGTLSKCIRGKTLEETEQNIAELKKTFDESVQKQVEKQMRGTTPRTGSGIHGMSGYTDVRSQVWESLV